MDEIFNLYKKVEDPDFIGQDDVAQQILNLAKKVEQEEYDQARQSKYYQVIRWAVEHLSQNYRESNDLKNYFNLISQIKEIKNTRKTFTKIRKSSLHRNLSKKNICNKRTGKISLDLYEQSDFNLYDCIDDSYEKIKNKH